MLWERLVTPGHVLTARLKRIMIPFAVAGALFAVYGTFLTSLRPFPSHSRSTIAGVQQRIAGLKAQISNIFSRPQPIRLKVADVQNLPAPNEIDLIDKAIRAALDKDGRLPDSIKFEQVSRKRFWGYDWPKDKVAVYRSDTDVAVGAIVDRPRPRETNQRSFVDQPASDALRWLAIYKKTQKGWNPVDLRIQGFYLSSEMEAVAPNDIPETLRILLKLPEL